MTKKKPKPDPLQDLLDFIANESHLIGDEALSGRLDALRRAWLNAGCPGSKFATPKPAPPTIRVRIAVVQRGERWSAAGWNAPSGGERRASGEGMEAAAWCGLDDVEDGHERLDFVECELPAAVKQEPKTWTGEISS
jgi:hypothetical protein